MQRHRTGAGILAVLGLGLTLISCSDDGRRADAAGTDTTEPTETTEASSDTTAASDETGATTGDTTEGTSAGSGPAMAPEVECPEEEQGLTDTEMVLGGSYPLSGPVAAYGVIPQAVDAWFQYLNETEGGITAGDGVTREVTFNVLDDQYSPDRTLSNVRQLIESDGVWLIFNPLGTPSNTAIRDYMNENEVPQLLVATGASKWGNEHEDYPWTIGYQPDYESEGIAYVRYVLDENPDATIGVLYQNDDFGKDYLTGIQEGLGDAADQLISEVTYEVTDATIDNQVSQVVDSGADAIMLIATPQFAIQGINRVQALGYEGTKIVTSVSSSVAAVMSQVADGAADDWVTSVYLKDPASAEYDDDEAMNQYREILGEYAPDVNPEDGFAVYGMSVAQTLQRVLEATPNVCRAGVMEAVRNLDWPDPPLLLEGIGLKTGEGDYFPIQQVQLERWEDGGWVRFGDVIDASEEA